MAVCFLFLHPEILLKRTILTAFTQRPAVLTEKRNKQINYEDSNKSINQFHANKNKLKSLLECGQLEFDSFKLKSISKQ